MQGASEGCPYNSFLQRFHKAHGKYAGGQMLCAQTSTDGMNMCDEICLGECHRNVNASS